MSDEIFRPVRIGVIGAGNFGRLHAHTLAGLAESELVAIVDTSRANLKTLPSTLRGIPNWSQLDRALESCDAEAWVIACSTADHVPVAQAILAAGLPVLLEKPISTDLESAQALSPFIKPESSNLMMGHILLFGSEFRGLRAELERRGPGAFINSVRHRSIEHLELYPGESPLRLIMIHDLYMTSVLTGGAEPVAFGYTRRRSESGQEDLSLVTLRWSDGTVASLAATFLTPPGMYADGFDRIEVFGRGWAGRANPIPRPLEIWDDRARSPMNLEVMVDTGPPAGMLAEELRHFCRVVRGRAPVPIGARYEDAIQIEHWLKKLEQSAEG